MGFLFAWLYRERTLFTKEVLETCTPIFRLGIDLPRVLIHRDRLHFILQLIVKRVKIEERKASLAFSRCKFC